MPHALEYTIDVQTIDDDDDDDDRVKRAVAEGRLFLHEVHTSPSTPDGCGSIRRQAVVIHIASCLDAFVLFVGSSFSGIQHPPTHTTSHARAALTMPPERPRIYILRADDNDNIYARDAYAKSEGVARRGPNEGARTTYRRGELHSYGSYREISGRCSRAAATL